MASTESTAVNDLIELSKQRRVDESVDDLLFDDRRRPAPLPPAMAHAQAAAAEQVRAAAESRRSAQIAVPPPMPEPRRSAQIAVPPPIPTARTSGSIPAFAPQLAGAEALEPLPRNRAPSATDHTHLASAAVPAPDAAAFAPAPTMAVAFAPAPTAIAAAAYVEPSPADSGEDLALTERRPRMDAHALGETMPTGMHPTTTGLAPHAAAPAWMSPPSAHPAAPLPAPLAAVPSQTLAGFPAAPMPRAPSAPNVTAPVHLVNGDDWFQHSVMMPRVDEVSAPVVAAAVPRRHEREVSTQGVKRTRATGSLLAAGAALAVVGVFAGGYFYFDRGSPAPRAAISAPTITAPTITAPTPAPTPAAAIAAPVAAAPQLIDVTFTSTPAGANVVLVDGGTPRPLGPTPITASVDPSKTYDVMFALDGYPTSMQRLAAGSGTTLQAVLAAPTAAAAIVAPAIVETPASARPATKASKPTASATPATRPAPSKPTTTASKPVATAPSGTGTILISSKPVCSIILDGKRTGQQTPARLTVSAGKHTVTLVSKEHGFERTGTVTVTAGGSVKVVKDFTGLIK